MYQTAENSDAVKILNEEVFRSITQLADVNNFDITGFYGNDGIFESSNIFGNLKATVNIDTDYYINLKSSNLTVTFFDNNGEFIDFTICNDSHFHVPNNESIAIVSIPIRKTYLYSFILSKTKVPIYCNYIKYEETINVNRIMDNENVRFLKRLKDNITQINNANNYELKNIGEAVSISVNEFNDDNKWKFLLFNTQEATLVTNGFILLWNDENRALAFSTVDNSLYYISLNNMSSEKLEQIEQLIDLRTKKINVKLIDKKLIISDFFNNEIYVNFNIQKYINPDTKCSIGVIYCNNKIYFRDIALIYDNTEFINFNNNIINNDSSHWKDKIWYAYGTSLTDIDGLGKYAKYVAEISGLKLNNKGIGGGGIVANKKIKNAVMNIDDRKIKCRFNNFRSWS